nr:hypothetical protein CFP56_56911 [Quercus suber]
MIVLPWTRLPTSRRDIRLFDYEQLRSACDRLCLPALSWSLSRVGRTLRCDGRLVDSVCTSDVASARTVLHRRNSE